MTDRKSEDPGFRFFGDKPGGLMIRRLKPIALVLTLIIIISGCWTRTRPASIPGYAEKKIRLMAVMPVKAKGVDSKFTRLIREQVLATLYFKGYPKVPLEVIDTKLTNIYKQIADDGTDIPPQAVRSLLNVDAVLYVTTKECKTDIVWLYAVTTVSADFELRNGKTGETLWKARTKSVERNFDITRQRLEQTACQVLEPAIQAVVEKALQGLPDGQDTI